ncbi:MAG: GntR family transcriptional regulator [Firmicutes bacterium]|nr:GntR family transcriptional regulator [Bacillota bacterium]
MRADINSLKLKPGEKISEARMAKKYNVSRAPVRDAIRRLQQDKLVLVKPQIGTIVAPVSLEKARDICQVRLLLEPYAAEIAAKRITDEDIEKLDKQFALLSSLDNKWEVKEKCIYETDSILHQMIWRLCGNKEIYQIIDGYQDEVHRIRQSTLKLANRAVPSEVEMRKIYQALRNKDPLAAREAMYEHILNLMIAVEGVLAEEK